MKPLHTHFFFRHLHTQGLENTSLGTVKGLKRSVLVEELSFIPLVSEIYKTLTPANPVATKTDENRKQECTPKLHQHHRCHYVILAFTQTKGE